jgi:Na+/proline symporter
MAKVPMQFFILFIGAMVFVVFLFVQPPLVFQPVVMQQVQASPQYPAIESRYQQAFDQRKAAARGIIASAHGALDDFRAAQTNLDAARADALKLSDTSDTNYIFLSFVTHYLPVGIVGLVVAVIFTAAMSAISGEINSLATVTVIDIYKRHMAKSSSDAHYLGASRVATVFWGIYAMVFASTATGFGALIEAVNQVGSLFYGGMLGVFVLAFFVKRCTATGAFVGVLAGEAAIFTTARFTSAFLWYNVVGCVVTVTVGWAISILQPRNK